MARVWGKTLVGRKKNIYIRSDRRFFMSMFDKFFKKISEIKNIIDAIKAAGGTAYLVGGSVRDLMLGVSGKDFDRKKGAYSHYCS